MFEINNIYNGGLPPEDVRKTTPPPTHTRAPSPDRFASLVAFALLRILVPTLRETHSFRCASLLSVKRRTSRSFDLFGM